MKQLRARGVIVDYCDLFYPEFPRMRRYQFDLQSKTLREELLQRYDCVVIGTDRDLFDYDLIFKEAHLVVDTRGRAREQSKRVFRA